MNIRKGQVVGDVLPRTEFVSQIFGVVERELTDRKALS